MNNRLKYFIVLFLVLLIIFPIPAIGQSAKDAIKALKKIEARCQIGISYYEYVRVLGEAKYEVNLFLEGKEAKKNPKLTKLIAETMEKYEECKEWWKFEIDHDIPNEGLISAYWGIASINLKEATSMLSK